MKDRKRARAKRQGTWSPEPGDGEGYCPLCDTWQTHLVRHEDTQHRKEMAE